MTNSKDDLNEVPGPERVRLWICCHCQTPRMVGLTVCERCHKKLHDTIEYTRIRADGAAPVVEKRRSSHFSNAAIDKGTFPDHISRDGTAYYSDGTVLPAAATRGEATGRQALAAELLGHLDRITSTTAAYHFVRNICKVELGLEPDSLGAEIDH